MKLNKIRAVVLAASLVLAGAGAFATAGAAHAATPSCGNNCLDVFSKDFGTHNNPQFVLDVYKQQQAAGAPIILFRTSNSDPAEDFTVSDQGSVADFYAAGLVSSTLALHYGCIKGVNFPVCFPPGTDDFAFELEYAPFGADTGLCVGVGSVAANGVKVSLQPCGVSSKTVWVADTVDSCTINPFLLGELPAINGSDTNFSHPYVLTYPGSSYPTDSPRPQLFTSQLTGFSQPTGKCNGGGSVASVNSNQLWAADTGILK